jgi:hypothetical protein
MIAWWGDGRTCCRLEDPARLARIYVDIRRAEQ